MVTAVYRELALAAAVLACAGCGRGTAMHGQPTAADATTVRVAATRPLMGVAWTITVHSPRPGDRRAGARRGLRGG